MKVIQLKENAGGRFKNRIIKPKKGRNNSGANAR
jgi:hypothetical protein